MSSELQTGSNPLDINFTGNPITGEGNTYQNNHLAGSKHIEWYTNQEILSSNAKNEGFIDCTASGFVRDNNKQIGGFTITNESGVNYHYALPAYSKEEVMYSENTEKGLTYNELKKPEKYAYTWYLTAVTDPDYVDKNYNGLVDDADYGYWVSFDYGLWTKNYQWRNPSEGFVKDLDTKFRNYSTGVKELYYLDAVRTKTHTALFIKEVRKDGKSVTSKEDGSCKGIFQ